MKKPIKGFGQRPAAEVEAEALARVERSTNAAWYYRADSWVPARIQLFFIRVWLFFQGIVS